MHKLRLREQVAGRRVDAHAQGGIHQMRIRWIVCIWRWPRSLPIISSHAPPLIRTRRNVTQVVDADVRHPGILLDLGPEAADSPYGFGRPCRRGRATGCSAVPPQGGAARLPGRPVKSARVVLALLDGRGGLRPDGIVEVELLELRRPHLAHPKSWTAAVFRTSPDRGAAEGSAGCVDRVKRHSKDSGFTCFPLQSR